MVLFLSRQVQCRIGLFVSVQMSFQVTWINRCQKNSFLFWDYIFWIQGYRTVQRAHCAVYRFQVLKNEVTSHRWNETSDVLSFGHAGLGDREKISTQYHLPTPSTFPFSLLIGSRVLVVSLGKLTSVLELWFMMVVIARTPPPNHHQASKGVMFKCSWLIFSSSSKQLWFWPKLQCL